MGNQSLSPSKKTATINSGGGGDFDEDSEGMEVLKEQMYTYS